MQSSTTVSNCSHIGPRSTGPRYGVRTANACPKPEAAHRHDYYEVAFFPRLGAMQRIAADEYIADPGSLFFIAPMLAHQLSFDPEDGCYLCYFDLEFLRPDLSSCGGLDGDLLARAPEFSPFACQQDMRFGYALQEIPEIESMFCRMLEAVQGGSMCSENIVRSTMSLLFGLVTQRYEGMFRERLAQRAQPRTNTHRHVAKALRYIEANLTCRLTLSGAAEAAAVTPNHLAHLMKRHTGRTFNDIVTSRRMAKAAELLSYTTLQVAQVAGEVGFEDPDYFSRRFKQTMGNSPAEFRADRRIGSGMGRG